MTTSLLLVRGHNVPDRQVPLIPSPPPVTAWHYRARWPKIRILVEGFLHEASERAV